MERGSDRMQPAAGAVRSVTPARRERLKQFFFRDHFRPELQAQFEQHSLERLRPLVLVLALTGIAGSALGVAAREWLGGADHTGLRLLLLPVMLLLAISLHLSPSVRAYGVRATTTGAVIMLNAHLGTLGLERPLMQFVPALAIVVLATSFFWVSFRQFLLGNSVCYAFLLPYAFMDVQRDEAVYGALYLVTTLGAALVAHYMMHDYRRRAFVQELRLEEMSATDELTGTFNRRQFLHAAGRASARLQQAGRPFCVLYVDIDHFKSLNDRFGHAAGDTALRSVAARIVGLVRPQDIVGRLGGEEFAVALPECAIADAAAMAHRLRAGVARLPRPDGVLTVSIGVAEQGANEDLPGALNRADLAMLAAKQEGRDTVRLAAAMKAEGAAPLMRS